MGRTSDARERLVEAVAELFWTHSYDGTTVDQICERAGVKKGSFYHFFSDKTELAQVSLALEWERYRTVLDGIFSASIPPLRRILGYCDHLRREQVELRDKYGCVLGCPICTLGSEVSTREQSLRDKVQEILDYHGRYFESAIRDAHAAGVICAPDARAKADLIQAYQIGIFVQARIRNELRLFDDLTRGTFDFLGVPVPRD